MTSASSPRLSLHSTHWLKQHLFTYAPEQGRVKRLCKKTGNKTNSIYPLSQVNTHCTLGDITGTTRPATMQLTYKVPIVCCLYKIHSTVPSQRPTSQAQSGNPCPYNQAVDHEASSPPNTEQIKDTRGGHLKAKLKEVLALPGVGDRRRGPPGRCTQNQGQPELLSERLDQN